MRLDRTTVASTLAGLLASGALIACSYAVPTDAAAEPCPVAERSAAGDCR